MKRALEAFIQYLMSVGVKGVIGIHVNRKMWDVLVYEIRQVTVGMPQNTKLRADIEQLEMSTPFGITLIVEPLEVKVEHA